MPRFPLRAARIFGAVVFCVILGGCGGGGSAGKGDDDRLYVVATTTMLADAAKQIGGDSIRLKGLMQPGVDPHLYEPTPRDGVALREAGLVLYNGHYLEGQMEKTLKTLKNSVAVAETVPKKKLIADKESGHADPHAWGDVALWRDCLKAVGENLAKADPENADAYEQRMNAHLIELQELDAWVRKRVEEVPKENRVLVTSHDAFNYFGRAYGFDVLGLQGISTVEEVGLAERVAMVDFIRENGIKAIFVESSVSPAVIESVSKDSGAKVGGELFSDALGQPGEIENAGGEEYDVGTYTGMIKHNVNAVVEALK